MFKSSFRLVSLLSKTHLQSYTIKPALSALQRASIHSFCKTKKHESNQKQPEDKTKQNEKQDEKGHNKGHNKDEKHHQHEPNYTRHQHQYHHKEQEVRKQHEPVCSHEHAYYHQAHFDSQESHFNVKLSQLTFDELVEIKTDDALKYANQIYEQEGKKLQALKEEKQNMLKSIELYTKVEEEILQKEVKLVENIKNVEEETVNAKKRAYKQIQQSKSFAVSKIAKQLLEVADCIASCQKFAQQHQLKDQYIENIINSQQIIKQILKKFDIEEFDPINQEYDANTQQSLVTVPTPSGYKPNHVAMVMRTGYTIKGRLLRSARVGVFT